MNNKIFITGANGFIGHHLVNFLNGKEFEIYSLIRKDSLPTFQLRKNVHIVYGDLTNKESLEKVIPQGSIIVNLAANPYDPKLSFEVNVKGTKNLVEVAKKKYIDRIIHISSQATKLKIQGVYAKTKKESDKIIKSSGIKYIILKPSLVYGEGEKGLFNKIRLFIEKIPIVPIFGDGETKINPIYIKDLCFLIELLIKETKKLNRVYDVGSSIQITYNDYYRSIIKSLGKKVFVIHIPASVGFVLGKVMLKLMKNPTFFPDNVLGSTQETFCNPSPLLKRYNYRPIEWQEGLKKIFHPQKVNVAVVGLGKMGSLHLCLLNLMQDVRIAALIDNNKQLFNTVKSMGISGNFYLNLEEALAKEKIDAVYIITPTFTHLSLLKKVLAKGKHVFIEKPVTLNKTEVAELKKMKTRSIIHVGYTLLFKKTFFELNKIIHEKKYGKIRNFEARFEHGEVFGPKKGWMFNKKTAGGGVLMNPGPHLFSLINLFFGIPKKISGKISRKYSLEVEDEADLIFTFEDFEGKVFLSWSVKNRPISRTNITVNFERAQVVVDSDKLVINFKNGKKLVIDEQKIQPLLDNVFNINPEANGDAYFIEDKLFIDSLLNRNRNNLNSLDFALDTESIIYNVYKSCSK